MRAALQSESRAYDRASEKEDHLSWESSRSLAYWQSEREHTVWVGNYARELKGERERGIYIYVRRTHSYDFSNI